MTASNIPFDSEFERNLFELRRSKAKKAASQRRGGNAASVVQSWRNMMAASGPNSVAGRPMAYSCCSIGR